MITVFELAINVRYCDSGTKVSQFFSKDSPESIFQLKRDLEQLKSPIPSEANVRFVSAGCMKAFWIGPLNGTLHKQLKHLVSRTRSPTLQIERITLSETPTTPGHHPYSNLDNKPFAPFYTSPANGSKRAHAFNGMSSSNDNAATGNPYSTLFSSPSARPLKRVKGSSSPGTFGWSPDRARWVMRQDAERRITKSRSFTSDTSVVKSVPSNGSTTSAWTSGKIASSWTMQEDAECSQGSPSRVPLPGNRSMGQIHRILYQRSAGESQAEETPGSASAYTSTQASRVMEPPTDKIQEMERAYDRLQEGYSSMQRARCAAQKQLAEANNELEMERAERSRLQAELASERKKRVEAENVLRDVQRECRAPFVVPALLEAFAKVSEATSWATDIVKP